MKLEEKLGSNPSLCPFADKCAVEPASNEICSNDYEYCKIYQELIKYKEEFLRK